MAIKTITGAVQTDADICNAFDPPTAGMHIGGGLHVVIPADWATRIAAGKAVAGCTYAAVQPNGSLTVTDVVQTKLAIPAEVNKLTPAQQTEAVAMQTKVQAAVAVGP